jgi:hypothetical protein
MPPTPQGRPADRAPDTRVWDVATGELIAGPPPLDFDEWSRQELERLHARTRRMREQGGEVLEGREKTNADGTVTRAERMMSKAEDALLYRERVAARDELRRRRRERGDHPAEGKADGDTGSTPRPRVTSRPAGRPAARRRSTTSRDDGDDGPASDEPALEPALTGALR